MFMSAPENSFEPELLQARWVLGGIEPEQLVNIAVSALQAGFDGVALQQPAGLSRPTSNDLGDLPARIFAGMGLTPIITKDEAVTLLITRGRPTTSPITNALRQVCPGFLDRWKKHVELWGGNFAGSYNDMAEFVHFVVEDVYEKGELDEAERVFRLLEKHLVEADHETQNLIALGFFETLRNVASWRPGGSKRYEQFLGPESQKIWSELQIIWAGKSSLMDVVRAEQKALPKSD
jgi:hypothetical protein